MIYIIVLIINGSEVEYILELDNKYSELPAKKHGTTRLMWKIWFADDCGSKQSGQLRSYEILKDNETIYTMSEEEIMKSRFIKEGRFGYKSY